MRRPSNVRLLCCLAVLILVGYAAIQAALRASGDAPLANDGAGSVAAPRSAGAGTALPKASGGTAAARQPVADSPRAAPIVAAGTVLDRARQPVPRCRLEWSLDAEERMAIGDAAGRFEVELPRPGEWRVTIARADLGSHERTVRVDRGAAPVELSLDVAPFRVRLVSGAASSLAGEPVQVHRSTSRDAYKLQAEVMTGADGTARGMLVGCGQDRLRVVLGPGSHFAVEGRFVFTVDDGTDLVVPVAPRPSATVLVVDARGEPYAGPVRIVARALEYGRGELGDYGHLHAAPTPGTPGRYRVSGLKPSGNLLWVVPEDDAVEMSRRHRLDAGDHVQVVLHPATPVRLDVRGLLRRVAPDGAEHLDVALVRKTGIAPDFSSEFLHSPLRQTINADAANRVAGEILMSSVPIVDGHCELRLSDAASYWLLGRDRASGARLWLCDIEAGPQVGRVVMRWD